MAKRARAPTPADSLERDWTAPDRDRRIVDEVARFLEAQEAETKRFPKNLVLADNDLSHRSHADQLVTLLRERLHRGDDFVQKITGSQSVDRPPHRIRQFRNRREPGVVATVDLLSTGVDIPWLGAIVFLRRVQSRILFEQILGRGTRRCEAIHKAHFTVFAAVGVLECFRSASEFTFEPPAKPTRPVPGIVGAIADNQDQAYNILVLVKRLQRVDKNITAKAGSSSVRSSQMATLGPSPGRSPIAWKATGRQRSASCRTPDSRIWWSTTPDRSRSSSSLRRPWTRSPRRERSARPTAGF